MTVDVKRFEQVRRRAIARTSFDVIGRLLTYSVGDHVWARRGQLRGVDLGRVLSARPVSRSGVDRLREWWQLALFSDSDGLWLAKPTFRRVLRALTPTEVGALRAAGVIEGWS